MAIRVYCTNPQHGVTYHIAGTTAAIECISRIVHVSYGVTPFKGVGRIGIDISFSDPYYESDRYANFLNSVYRNADDFDVEIESEKRALGIWEGSNEPSSAIDVIGTRNNIESVAKSICTEFEQYAVLIIYQPGNGAHKLYSFDTGNHDPLLVVETLHEAGISEARVTDKKIEITNKTNLNNQTLSVMERIYGKAVITPCEIVLVSTNI